MKLELAEPQPKMVKHLAEHPDALLFAGMGLSKTAACLYQLRDMLQDGQSKGALIVAPLRVANLTWPMEGLKWDQFKWMKMANLRTESGQRAFLNGTAHAYLINWDSIPLLTSLIQRRRGRSLPYDTAIFDELTRAKNPSSKRVNLYRREAPRVERHWGLTGTPAPNSLLDLFAQVRLIDGGKRLGTRVTEFKNTYFNQINCGLFSKYEPKKDTAEKLEKAIADITLTLKTSDYLDIPDTYYEDVPVEFTPELREKYKRLEKQLVIELKQGNTINVASAAALIQKLLQFTSGEVYDESGQHHPIHDLKFAALKRIVKSEKQPLFVSCGYVHEYQRMKETFPNAVFMNDAKSIPAQMKLIQDWEAKRIPILYAHPASMGHGLNLQFGSSLVAFLSLTYNREHYEQVIGRFARRGQTEVTKVYRLMVPGTVDDAVASALETKAKNEARLISALQLLEAYRTTK